MYHDGARFIPLAAVSDANLLATTLVSVFDLHEGASKPPQTRLLNIYGTRRCCRSDNFEQIIDAAPMVVAELLAQCACGTRNVLTSR